MVRKDRNHPSRDHVLDRQRDPRRRQPRGRGARSCHRPSGSVPSTTPVSSPTRSTRCSRAGPSCSRRWRGATTARRRGARGDGRQHDDDDDGRSTCRIILQQEIVDERTAESYAYLDVCGYNYTESRYAMDHELHPQRVIVGSETNPKKIARELGTGARAPARHRRLHLDRLGLPRRVRHRARCATSRTRPTLPAALMGPYPWITSNTGDIDITGFRRPVSYWREIVWGLRDTPVPRGAAARAPRRGVVVPGRLVVHRRDRVVVVAGVRGEADHGRGVLRCRRGGAAGER